MEQSRVKIRTDAEQTAAHEYSADINAEKAPEEVAEADQRLRWYQRDTVFDGTTKEPSTTSLVLTLIIGFVVALAFAIVLAFSAGSHASTVGVAVDTVGTDTAEGTAENTASTGDDDIVQ